MLFATLSPPFCHSRHIEMSSKFSDNDAKSVVASAKSLSDDEMYSADSKWDDDAPADMKVSKQQPDSKSIENLEESELLDRMQAYFFEDEQLSKYFENFIADHCHIVDLQSEEYKLEYTTVFQEYKAQYESKMESYIANILHSSIHEVYAALKNKVDNDENSMGAFFAQILIAVTDFDVFMTVMREMARSQQVERK
jgi:hypothetical protein